jgi:methylmalonyl-CoA mutase cobalamin-binding subunit
MYCAGALLEITINQEINLPLHQTLVSHVIPQLLDTAVKTYAKASLQGQHSVLLGKACVSNHSGAAEAYARGLLAKEYDIESLFLDTIPQTARLFHDWWNNDEIDFIQVTTGIFRLEELVYSLSSEFVLGGQMQTPGRQLNALLLKPEGSHHSLGLLLLSQYFKRHGWHVFSANQFTDEDMSSAVKSEWVDLIGISLSEDHQIPSVKKLIARLRKQSGNPQVQVMVGGPLLRLCPDLSQLLGADFACLRADQAQSRAKQHVQMNLSLGDVNSG